MRGTGAGEANLRPGWAAVVAITLFFALVIAGWGMLSLILDENVIIVPGLGQLPGLLATASAGLVVAATAARGAGRGILVTTVIATAGAYLVSVLVLGISVAVVTSDLGRSLAVTARAASAWPGAVIAGSALCASILGAIAGRGSSVTARWPWERDDPEE